MAKSSSFGMQRCPICGKEFIPAPYHAYKIDKKLPNGNVTKVLVCSWSCLQDSRRVDAQRGVSKKPYTRVTPRNNKRK